ncbi:MAG: zf-HC2 domain-containing protein [Actinomycetota bacterium]|nr:zf-HC2 domain-containing protein [Actinomycetota bacterium]
MNGPRPCEPEPIFELADGSLSPEREREIRAHLRDCSRCRTLYERELRLSASLGSLEFEEANSVCRSVAMALPTRSTKARLLWAMLAVVLLLMASVAMIFFGTNFAVLVVDAMNVFWGFVAGFADVIQVVFAAIGQALLIALAIGAFVDLAIAAVYLGVSRRHTREV